MNKLSLRYDRDGRLKLVPVEDKPRPEAVKKKSKYPYFDLFELKKELPIKVWYHNHYLKSKLWANIKAKILKRDSYVCQICGEKANQVHHTDYSIRVLKGHDKHKLTSLCGHCHFHIEKTPEGQKRPLKLANERMQSLKDEITICGEFLSDSLFFFIK